MARLTEVGWAQTVRTAMKSHSTSPESDAVCQNSMPCDALTDCKENREHRVEIGDGGPFTEIVWVNNGGDDVHSAFTRDE